MDSSLYMYPRQREQSLSIPIPQPQPQLQPQPRLHQTQLQPQFIVGPSTQMSQTALLTNNFLPVTGPSNIQPLMAPIPVRPQTQHAPAQASKPKAEKTSSQQLTRPMDDICRVENSQTSSSVTSHVQSTSSDNRERSEASTSATHRSKSRQQQPTTSGSKTKHQVISRYATERVTGQKGHPTI